MPNEPRGTELLGRRRFLGLAAGAAAATVAGPTLLTGCGARTDKTLTFWQFYAPVTQDDPTLQKQSKWFERLVEQWNDEHDVKVRLVFIQGTAYLNGTKLPTAFAAEDGPDIFLISPGDFLRYYNGGVLQDLTPHLSAEARADYFPDTLTTRSVDGRVYALPMEVEPLAIFYSRPAWEKAGLSEGDIPTTWDDLLRVAEKLTTGHQSGMVFETVPGYYQNFTFYPWMWQAGGEVLNADQTRSTLDGEGVVRALTLWHDSVRTGVSPRTLPAGGDLIAGLTQGLAAMWHSGIWNVASFRDNEPDFDYGVFKAPVPEGGEYTTDLGGWAFVANARGRDPETAAEFCAYALGSMEDHTVKRVTDWCVGAKTDIAPRKSVLRLATERGGYKTEAMKAFKDDIFPGGRAEPRYPPVIYKAISDAIQATQLAGADPRQAADTARQAVDAYLETYEGPRML